MTKLKRVVANRQFILALIVLVLLALIWLAGPLIAIGGFTPLEDWIGCAIASAVVVLAAAALALFWVRRSRKAEHSLADSVAGTAEKRDAVKDAVDGERQVLQERLQSALAELRQLSRKRGSASLYELPWYVIIGPPGSGKTTALHNSGLSFPLAEKYGPRAMRGVGGTRNCDWWFTEKAVLLDTAGRYTTQDSDDAVDAAGWKSFLSLLVSARPRQPLNGILVVLGVPDLIDASAAERAEHAHAIRTRLLELDAAFGMRLPIYLVLTKLDRLAGFVEFFDDLDREARDQVLGATFALAPANAEAPLAEHFEAEFNRLLARLRRQTLDRLQSEAGLEQRAAIFGFASQFASLRPIIKELIGAIFSDSRFARRPMLRGFYLTSATQQGSPIDRLVSLVANRFGIERAAPPPRVGQGRGYFLRRLFDDVVFAEAGLAGANPVAARRFRLLRIAGYAAIALSLLGVSAAWTLSFFDNRRLIDDAIQALDQGRTTAAAAEKLALDDGDPRPLLPALGTFRTLPAGYAQRHAGAAVALDYGLGQAQRVGVQTEAVYRRALESLLVPRLLVRLQRQLIERYGEPEALFRTLKSYLLLGNQGPAGQQDGQRRAELAYLRAWMIADWTAAGYSDAHREALLAHFDALTSEAWSAPALDQELIAAARQKIAGLSLAQRALRELLESREVRELPLWRPIDRMGREQASTMIRRSGRSLADGIPGAFTKAGYYAAILRRFEDAAGLTRRDQWVIAATADERQASNLRTDLIRLYMNEYIRVWEEIVADLRFVQLGDIKQAAATLQLLSGAQSPFALLLRAVAQETRLSRAASAPASPAAAAAIAAQSQEAIDQLQRLLGGGQNLSELVDQRFAWLHEFVGSDGAQGTPLGDYLEALKGPARAVLKCAVENPEGCPEAIQAANQLVIEAEKLPGALRAPARELGDALKRPSESEAIRQLRARWNSDVLPSCERTVRQRYPFVRGIRADAPFDDFRRVFGKDELIDTFVKRNLQARVDMSGPKWRVRGAGLPISDEALDQFRMALEIRDAFFPVSPTLSLSFRLTSIAIGTAAKASVEIDGQILAIEGASAIGTLINWPVGAGVARVIVDGATTTEHLSPWGFLRLFDQVGPPGTGRRSDDRYELSLPGGVRVQVLWSSVKNPLSVRRTLQDFKCPQL